MKRLKHPEFGILFVVLMVWGCWRTIHLIGTGHHHLPTHSVSPEVSSVPVESSVASGQTLAFAVRFTNEEWHGKPVFQLVNHSRDTLHNVMLYSFAGNFMVPLWIGDTAPVNIPSATPLHSPPYDLAPKASVWFVAPEGPPLEIYVMWEEGSHLFYEYVLSTE